MDELQQMQDKIAQLQLDLAAQEIFIQNYLKETQSDIARAYCEKRHRTFEMAKMLEVLSDESTEERTTYQLPNMAEKKQEHGFDHDSKPLNESLYGENTRDKNDEVKAKATALEKKARFQKETIQTLLEISRVVTLGTNIEQKQRSVAISKLLCVMSPKVELKVDKQARTLVVLGNESRELNRKITRAFLAEDTAQRDIDDKISTMFSYFPGDKLNCVGVEGCERGTDIHKFCKIEVLVIPNAVMGKKVVSIGRSAFEYMNMKEVIIPSAVTTIGEEAFRECKKLNRVNLPVAVTTIGAGAFSGCHELKEVNLPDALSEISGGCFYGTGIEKVALPENIRKLSRMCFKNCTNLARITLNDGITAIESEALCNTKIRRIVFPESLLKVDIQALAYSRVDIACMGMETTFDIHGGCNLEGCRNYTIYCLPDSAMEKQCRKRGLRVRPLNEFPNRDI